MAVLPGQTARSVLSHRLAGPTTAALADRTTGAGLNPSGVKQNVEFIFRILEWGLLTLVL